MAVPTKSQTNHGRMISAPTIHSQFLSFFLFVFFLSFFLFVVLAKFGKTWYNEYIYVRKDWII